MTQSDAHDRLIFKRPWSFLRFSWDLILIGTVFTIAAIPALNWIGIRIVPGAIGLMLFNLLIGWRRVAWWVRLKAHQGEEWAKRKPVLEAKTNGLFYEDGGPQHLFFWEQIGTVMIHRKVAPWKTHGSFNMIDPYWLEIDARTEHGPVHIEVAPWEVECGLRALRRFAETMRVYREAALKA